MKHLVLLLFGLFKGLRKKYPWVFWFILKHGACLSHAFVIRKLKPITKSYKPIKDYKKNGIIVEFEFLFLHVIKGSKMWANFDQLLHHKHVLFLCSLP
jgi:hypothetical protein